MASPAAQAEALVPVEIVDGGIAAPLTSVPGSPERGRMIVRDLSKASCLICHAMPIPEEPDHGQIGPPLDGIGSAYSVPELRLRLVDPKAINPETLMPSYYRIEGLTGVLARYAGQPIYTAQEVEDVVAYLATLKAE
ncbi:MAG: sulfur oxidation c-type cytochrome SoxX [Devosia sp.]